MINFFLLLLSLFVTPAQAQCNGQFGAFSLCGNLSSTTSVPIQTPVSGNTGSVLSVAPGITAGCVQIDANGNATSTGANCGNAGATAPGGSTTQVQFNSSGAFAGSSTMTFASGALTLNGSGVSIPGSIQAGPALQVGTGGFSGIIQFATGPASFDVLNNHSGGATNGDMFNLVFHGYDTTGYPEGARMEVIATTTWTSQHHGTKMDFQTTPSNSTTENIVLTLDQDKSATFTGAVNINAGALSAPGTGNVINLVLSGSTTLTGDNGLGLLRTNSAGHQLISDASAAIVQGYLVYNANVATISNTAITLNNYGLDVGSSGLFVGLDTVPEVRLVSIGPHGSSNPQILMMQAENAGGLVPGATLNGAFPGLIQTEGYDGAHWQLAGLIYTQAIQNWTGAAFGTGFFVQLVPKDSTSTVVAMQLESDVGLKSTYQFVGPNLNLTGAAVSVGGGISYGGTTAVSSNCGSLAGGSACVVINVAGVTHYIPYY